MPLGIVRHSRFSKTGASLHRKTVRYEDAGNRSRVPSFLPFAFPPSVVIFTISNTVRKYTVEPLKTYGATERHWRYAAQYPALHLARIVSQAKELYRIVTEGGEGLASVSGKIMHAALTDAQYPTVGDFVLVDRLTDDLGNAAILHVLPRSSAFVRKSAGGAHGVQVVASNIDVAFCCMACNGDFNPSRLERYLSVAWSSGATPVVVLTKADLSPDLPAALNELAALAPGTDVIAASRDDQNSVACMLAYLKPGVTGALLGSSGIGKSTLINRMLGSDTIKTADVRGNGKGRHTTTRRELLLLPNGGLVIDTPGMRELGAESVDLSHSFADIDALTKRCRFADCTHTTEPGCAVREAVETGALDERRLASYQKLQREASYDGLDARQTEKRKCDAMFADVGGMKNVRKYIRETNKRKGE